MTGITKPDDVVCRGVSAELVRVENLTLDIDTPQGTAHILRGVSMSVARGQTLGIVGESGSGKSMTLRTVLGLTPSGSMAGGTMTFDGEDLSGMNAEARRVMLGRRVGVVFQNPMTSLNPVVTIGRQMGEAVRFHKKLSKRDARELSVELLGQVGIPEPGKRLADYPHQFSGGMRQRVMIAMALTCEPDLLIADEATTALDVTIQKGILDLLQRLQAERQMAMIIVSHDLSVVAGRTDEVVVMYGGRIVDRRRTAQLFEPPLHPYTNALMRAIPRLNMTSHTRLPALGGNPPSVFDPIMSAEEVDRKDRERWATISESVVDAVDEREPGVIGSGLVRADGPTAIEVVVDVETRDEMQESGEDMRS
ncbi:ABC transporter ATP-binding protein [Luethyella okanaganae]|uniref:ABC transporter ATP-binding protein n=1 Tax=Luethyella okanaganae TaxID=69372 RepID=A0ABW1VJB6_9MICO